MPAVLVALYEQHATAEAARTELVNDGFPTDRVELTSTREPGHAGMVPAEGRAQRFREYFRTLFHGETSERRAEAFTNRVCEGRAAVTVHPRGEPEIARAKKLLRRHHPQELAEESLDDTAMEQAAANSEQPVIEQVVRGHF
jgi:hypothetical protein